MKHLNWGLIAAGNIAHSFARGLESIPEAATRRAVAARDAQKAKAFAEEHDFETSYGSYDELLDDEDVDAVYISAPNSLHAEWSIKAAEAGKHILCEKPATTSTPELERVLEAVKKADVFFMEAFMYRCHPQWAKLREILDAGRIGTVRMLESRFCFDLHGGAENIRMSNALAGGALMDVGCYCVSFFRMVMEAEPVDIRATAHIGEESRVDEYTAGAMRFRSGAVARFVCATQCAAPIQAEIFGSDGSIEIGVPWCPGPGKTPITLTSGGTKQIIEVECAHDLYANEAITVAEHIDRRQTPAMRWDDSLGNMRTLDALRASMGLAFDGE
jgi:predicted dehydrogenase